MIKWWAQTYVVGIKKIICGLKTENEIKSLEQVNVDQILSKVKVSRIFFFRLGSFVTFRQNLI